MYVDIVSTGARALHPMDGLGTDMNRPPELGRACASIGKAARKTMNVTIGLIR